MTSNAKTLTKSFESPNEGRTFEKGKVEIVNLGNVIIGRATFEPGWSWGTFLPTGYTKKDFIYFYPIFLNSKRCYKKKIV